MHFLNNLSNCECIFDYFDGYQFADNKDLHNEWRVAKKMNKMKIVSYIKDKTGYDVSPDAMFDIQVIPQHKVGL